MFLLALFASPCSNAQEIVNDGNAIKISANSYFVTGNYTNITTGALSIASTGVLKIAGNLLNNSPSSTIDFGNGLVQFFGTSSVQIIGGTTTASDAFIFYNLSINPNGIKLAKNIIINNNLNITNGILYTGANIVSLSSAATLTGGSASCFIDGKLKKTGNGSSFTFQTGDVRSGIPVWAPLQIASWSNTNDFTVHYSYKHINDSLGIHTWADGSSMGTGIDHVSGKEFWLVDRTGAGTQTPTVTLYWKDATKSEIEKQAPYDGDTLSDLALVHWNGSQWDNMGGTASGTWPSGQITNSVAFSGYSPITFGSKTGKNPLPVELLDFSGICNNTSIDLFWNTASETNNNFFTLEYTDDLQNWSFASNISGAGNSNVFIPYHYSFYQQVAETIFFRLKQTDFDGNFSYSEIISVSCDRQPFEYLQLYPNPANNSFNIVFKSNEETFLFFEITDILGQILYEDKKQVSEGINNIPINVSFLAPALYFFMIKTDTGQNLGSKQILIK
ncbi:MAG: hypothetical protein A2275_14145 [Bacteroidetes bacterium RIFOXYA12_FULL_35_11]|nr:MAG: hypothetical protein A2X01_15900 [Bacteroidetes bacterium GWF2_35_48]OFY83507.1 MAG: hypothetical protein A2275_14145 [Bacteroidetes bacterium RIFOXYA12_FULL_35_11]OFZ02363.1 MAG: hypothetical protein A2491_11195 [Bacteroidetes bacterium RIFOXYC12_FULL_35_7]